MFIHENLALTGLETEFIAAVSTDSGYCIFTKMMRQSELNRMNGDHVRTLKTVQLFIVVKRFVARGGTPILGHITMCGQNG